jgi:hypothetical protein
LEGLLAATSYVYTVQAINAAGASNASTPSPAVNTTSPVLPDSPRTPSIVPCDGHDAGSMSMTWLPPLNEGGAPVTTFIVVVNASGPVVTADVASVNASSDEVQMLQVPSSTASGNVLEHVQRKGSGFRFGVVGVWVPAHPLLSTERGSISKPQGVSAFESCGESDGGANPSSPLVPHLVLFVLVCCVTAPLYGDAQAVPVVTTIHSLSANTTYYFAVVAMNAVGTSPLVPVPALARTGLATPPATPTSITVTALGTTNATIAWTIVDTSGVPLVGFRVFYEIDAVASLLSAPDAVAGSYLMEGTGQWVGGSVVVPGSARSVVRVIRRLHMWGIPTYTRAHAITPYP